MIRDLEPHFDRDYYLEQIAPDATGVSDPIEHYLVEGAALGLDPAADFSTEFYLASNADVARSGVNPFWHFIMFGREEGRLGRPSEAGGGINGRIPPERERSIVAQEFDPGFYRQNYDGLPDSDRELAEHYCTTGWRLGHDPNGDFSTRHYLDTNPDVAAAKINPFVHFILFGRAEGRSPKAPVAAEAEKAPRSDENALDDIIGALRPHFDTDHYLNQYPDVARAGVDPVHHYCAIGWTEGRDPHPEFSTLYYLESNPDIEAAGVNPFWHYLMAGKSEGRRARHPGGYRSKILRDLQPLEKTVQTWLREDPQPQLLAAGALKRSILGAFAQGATRLVLSVGHDHYRNNSGGVQLCIQREEKLAPEYGAVYLNLHPWQPLPRLAHAEDDPDPAVCLVLNGCDLGVTKMTTLIRTVGELNGLVADTRVVVHNLLGHLPEQIVALVHATRTKQCLFWLHDFLSLCPSFTLQRNSITFCNAPDPTSNACFVCRFGAERRDHLTRIAAMFEALDVHVLSPSRATRELWVNRGGLRTAGITVVPHIRLVRKRRKQKRSLPSRDAITVGYIGTPASHKGWPVFEKLVRDFGRSDRYRFVFLGVADVRLQGLSCVPVHVTTENPTAMIDAVEQERIDLVLHWATWPETFSLSTYEALAGGAYVVTNEISGNVADTTRRRKSGIVLPDDDTLFAFFGGEEIVDLASRRRRAYEEFEVRYSFGKMSHSVLQMEAG
ncbi:MAG: hypothetical protein ACE5FS_11130 [Paracoccaceae bacterium]